MNRNGMLRLAALAAVIAALTLTPLGAAHGEASAKIDDVGWWSRNPGASAPAGGFAVSRTAEGDVSVGAIAFTINGHVEAATLNLKEAGGLQQDGAQLQVCFTPNAWAGGDGAKPWAEAPKAECDGGSAELTRNAAAAAWAADISNLLAAYEEEDGFSDVSIMVVPAGDGAVPLGFEVQFNPPELDATVTEVDSFGASSDSFSSDDFDSSDSSSTATTLAADGSFGGASAGFASDTSFSAPLAPSTPAATTPETAPPATTDTAATTDGADTGGAEFAAVPSSADTGANAGGGNRALQAFFFFVVSLVCAVGAGFGRWFLRQRTGAGTFA